MRIMIDTNILLDFFLHREPYYNAADSIFQICITGKADGCIAAHSITNMFFILRKVYSSEQRRSLLLDLFHVFAVEGLEKEKLLSALKNNDFADFEDCLQMECAKAFHADYIVSRNQKDFIESAIPCISPDELVQKMKTE